MTETHTERRSNWLLLAGLLLAALVLRLIHLSNGLWFDEITTYVKYARMSFGEIVTTYDSQNQHFLYTLLAHAAFVIFGESAWALRLPAALFGVGSIGALYLLARRFVPPREALLSVALLTFSYHHIWFSQNARGYSGLLFWTLLTSWLMVRVFQGEGNRLWIAYAITAALGVYTQMTMLFVVVGHFVIYLLALWTRRHAAWSGRWLGVFLGFGLAACLTLLLHAPVLGQMFGGVMSEGGGISAWKNPLWTLLELLRGLRIGLTSGIAAVGALIVLGLGMWDFLRRSPLVIQLLFIPAAICAIAVVGMGHHLWPRFFFFTMGFGVMVVVRGTMILGQFLAGLVARYWRSSPVLPLGALLGIGLVLISALSLSYAYAPKQDFPGALAFIEEHQQPGDAVVTVGITTFPYKYLYQTDWEAVETLEQLNRIRFHSNRTWLLYTLPIHLEAVYPDIMATIRNDFKVVEQFHGTLAGGTIVICQWSPSVFSRTEQGK